jgi:hypothetical protein
MLVPSSIDQAEARDNEMRINPSVALCRRSRRPYLERANVGPKCRLILVCVTFNPNSDSDSSA